MVRRAQCGYFYCGAVLRWSWSVSYTHLVKNFSYTIIDDDIYYRENSLFIKKQVSDKNKEKIKDYLALNEALKDVIYKQKEDFSEDEINLSQKRLNEVYDDFSKKHGFINNLSNTRALREDSNFPLVSSIEVLDEEDVYKRQVLMSLIINPMLI